MRVALLLALTGCDALFFLNEPQQRDFDAPPSDVAPDALVPACTGIGSLLCADFDEADIEYFSAGATFTVSPPGGMVTLAKVDPGNTGKGLRFDANGDMYYFDVPGNGAVTHIEVRAYVRFDRVTTFATQSSLLVAGVGTNDAGYSSCYAALLLDPSSGRSLQMQHSCGGNAAVTVLTALSPNDWTELSLVFDLTMQTATAYVNGTIAGTLQLGAAVKTGTQPFAHVGLDGVIDAAVAFDDVIAIAQ